MQGNLTGGDHNLIYVTLNTGSKSFAQPKLKQCGCITDSKSLSLFYKALRLDSSVVAETQLSLKFLTGMMTEIAKSTARVRHRMVGIPPNHRPFCSSEVRSLRRSCRAKSGLWRAPLLGRSSKDAIHAAWKLTITLPWPFIKLRRLISRHC